MASLQPHNHVYEGQVRFTYHKNYWPTEREWTPEETRAHMVAHIRDCYPWAPADIAITGTAILETTLRVPDAVRDAETDKLRDKAKALQAKFWLLAPQLSLHLKDYCADRPSGTAPAVRPGSAARHEADLRGEVHSGL